MLLSVIIPAYNEEKTIETVLDKVKAAPLWRGMEREIVVIDDCSIDNTELAVKRFIGGNPDCKIVYYRQEYNQGKGAALHKGITIASGNYLIVQDADLEYDPKEYKVLLEPLITNTADVVYGSRFMGGQTRRVLFFWHSIGNKFLTLLSNMFTDVNLTDMETCYKAFKSEIIKGLTLKEKRFGFEPEITAKVAKIQGIRIYEVGISYYGRTYAEGKKINWKDGFRAIYCILRYNLFE